LKVSIGAKIIDGPWGGGNLFVINLSSHLIEKGHEVIYDLNDDDIDLILLTDPRKSSESSTFTHRNIKRYKKKNSKVKVVHRINECDERKNTRGLNKFYIKANRIADHTIFVSNWLKNLYLKSGFENPNYSVIYSGSDKEVFNDFGKTRHVSGDPYKIVTHHWGGNWNKGFQVYEKLDKLIKKDDWNKKIQFTYIGNIPKNFRFENTKHISPLNGDSLAKELKKHDIYLTASLNEPSGNHHIEGAQCGLPLLYLKSGALPEYCEGYGLEFNENDFIEKLDLMTIEYESFYNKMKSYPRNAKEMSEEYLELFINLMKNE
tara:strand:+ start:12426 stop:13379 length:954 start_codon:yes stop_codon:yes gene_type:complete